MDVVNEACSFDQGHEMRILVLLLLLLGCFAVEPELRPGDCVLGTGMALWKLQRQEGGRFLFIQFPESRGAKVVVVNDLRTYKKVDCRDRR